MGFQKTRFTELAFFGCLAVLLRLRSPLRPSDQSDMFPYADPFGASLLDPVMSDMIFAIAKDSNPIGDSSAGSITIAIPAFGQDRRLLGVVGIDIYILPDPRLFENNLPRTHDSTLSKNSPSMFFDVYFGSCDGTWRAFPGSEEGERDFSHKFDPRAWYMGSSTMVKQKEGGALEEVAEEEGDEEQIEIFFKHQTPDQDNNIHPFWLLNNNSGAHDHVMCCVSTLFNNGLNLATTDVSIIFGGIIVIIILSIIGWKRMKNKKYFISNNRFHALIFNESNLDDQIVYENLLKEAISLISEGSSGIVFKVMFYGLECAMKVFFFSARMDFINEYKIVADLEHPHIINFFCVFGKSIIIMELMDRDLSSFITEIRERHIKYDMPLEVALDLMLQIAEGVSYLHNQGIAHQDLKSLNILLKFQGEFHSPDFKITAKIADFGSARSFDPRCREGFVLPSNKNIGTRFWRAPELFHPRGGFSAKEEDFEIMPKPLDIYGFALICSEIITKQTPFSNNNDQTIVLGARIRDGYRPALPSNGYPRDLITLITACWETNPCLRPEFHEICTRLKLIVEANAS